jgi:hypothetical protein
MPVNIDQQRVVLGYDARQPVERVACAWTAERRQKTLLRPDVRAPLSVDPECWPSVIGADVERPSWTGAVQELWDRLGELRALLADAKISNAVTIAVTLNCSGSALNDLARWESRIGDISPAYIPAEARLVGYDVADEWLESAVCNFAFLPDEDPQRLRDLWAGRLNAFHLFDDASAAADFRTFASSRNVEHAPFFQYELWGID